MVHCLVGHATRDSPVSNDCHTVVLSALQEELAALSPLTIIKVPVASSVEKSVPQGQRRPHLEVAGDCHSKSS